MADEAPAPAPEEKPAEKKKSGGGLIYKLVVGAVVGFIIMAECLVTYFVLPSDSQLAAHYEAKRMMEEGDTLDDENPEEIEPAMAEIQLGKFSISKHDVESERSWRVEFNLVAVALEEEAKELDDLLAVTNHRLRERIIFEFRNAALNHLNDPELGLLKRQILEKSNALFGKPLVRAVVFSEYSSIEQ